MSIEKEVQQFISSTVDSLVKWELLVFLYNNPGITDNTEGIASRLGRRKEDLINPLQSLHKNRVLDRWGEEKDPVYAYHPTPTLAKAIEKFVEFNNTKHGKLVIWSQLLKQGIR
ncbi:hypothetical protein JW933_10430 [candidate division FCPU426 bacterium]|nr:hypothetical protein [candidate division FCPU426 bacterium]